MSNFSSEELDKILEKIKQKIFTENSSGNLCNLLEKWGIEHKSKDNKISNLVIEKGNPFGKILIIGDAEIKKNKIEGMIKENLNLDNKQIQKKFEFILEYETSKTYNFNKLSKYDYAVILAGPMPHSGTVKEDNSSILTYLETNKDGYFPPVHRLNANGQLKITKSNLKEKLNELVQKGEIEFLT